MSRQHPLPDHPPPGHPPPGHPNPEHPPPGHPPPGHPLPAPGPGQDIFLPIATSSIALFPQRSDHPVPRTGVILDGGPIQTNKFYANFFLADQGSPTWTHPYSVAWSKGGGNAHSWGLAISHIEDDQKVFGDPSPRIAGNPSRFFFSPVGIQSIVLSAAELGSTTTLTTDTLTAFSINVNLQQGGGAGSKLVFPLVQGMGFVTGRYSNMTPQVQTSVFFRTVQPSSSPRSGIFKYKVLLEDGKSWLVYAIPDNGQDPHFQQSSNTLFQGQAGFNGFIQVAKNPSGAAASEAIYDSAAGTYPTTATVTGSVNGNQGQYCLSWAQAGRPDSKLLMFALPHHISSFDATTQGATTPPLTLATTTKGTATAVLSNSWTMLEPNLPTTINFSPYNINTNSPVPTLSPSSIATIHSIALAEAAAYQTTPSPTLESLTNDQTMYFSGKKAHRLARLTWTLHFLLNDPSSAAPLLTILKSAVSRFTSNTQPQPLVYDASFRGLVSGSGYPPGDPLADFGNTFYNDHHFHYAYWIHTAALLTALDPTWAAVKANKDWANNLAKDACNPSQTAEGNFPFSRNFDWYHGHSWAHGLFAFGDGKDLESTSEDAQFAYALSQWGRVSGDASMAARGTLMLGILRRTFNDYFLFSSDNAIQPSKFIGNKVSGILFENKCDHATFFDGNLYAIQGIHMLPLIPSSGVVRSKRFVSEEWDVYFKPGGAEPVDAIPNFWRGVVMANLALVDPRASWEFFRRADWQDVWLDDGQSRTWSLAMAAGLGGF